MADATTAEVSGKSMYELKDFVGNVATIVTIGLFMTGIFICKEIRRRGNTTDISPLPFLTGCVNCTVWLSYGVATSEFAICLVNSVGGALQYSYAIYYYIMTTDKRTYERKLAVTVGFLLIVFAIIYFFYDNKPTMTTILGTIASSCTLSFMGSPLAEIVIYC
ncbi:hypothetical protein CHUAL_013766 [Chamberlinius hualienensis]